MGMFDHIKFTHNCPVCNYEDNNYQSKAKDCILDILNPLDVNNFYTFCDNCNCWVDFTRQRDGMYLRTVYIDSKISELYTTIIEINK